MRMIRRLDRTPDLLVGVIRVLWAVDGSRKARIQQVQMVSWSVVRAPSRSWLLVEGVSAVVVAFAFLSPAHEGRSDAQFVVADVVIL